MNSAQRSWNALFLVTTVSACLYVLNEWIFYVTKPSFMSSLGMEKQLSVLFRTSLFVAGLFLLCLLPLALLNTLLDKKESSGWLVRLGAMLPAAILAGLVLIIVDNATYTLFRFGVVTSEGWSRALYGLGFLLVTAFLYRDLLRVLKFLSRRLPLAKIRPLWTLSALAGGMLATSMLALPGQAGTISTAGASPDNAASHPHILLITTDGLNASHTSLYGYERETTPNLEKLAQTSLVAENAFPNAGNTTGSIISIYTGKYPAETRVIYPPDLLRDHQALEHLPGLLRAYGYRTVQVTLPHYLDASVQNVLGGFDRIRTHKEENSRFLVFFQKILPNDPALFIDKILNRIVDRLRHIFFVRKMSNPFLLANQLAEGLSDKDRMDTLYQELHTSTQPLFVHVHLMQTHGEFFSPEVQVYSAGRSVFEQDPYETDFYDDSILEFDARIGELVAELERMGLLDNTILIIGSDHGQQFKLNRIPLLIRFPGGQHAGRIQANVQNLDIAPTLLDAIGVDIPEWMDGRSLLADGLEARPIFFANEADRKRNPQGGFAIHRENVKPPFYQFTGISMVYCSTIYQLDLHNGTWTSSPVAGSTYACPPELEISEQQAWAWIVGHLEMHGFDTSLLD